MREVLIALTGPALFAAAILAGALAFVGADRCQADARHGERLGSVILIAGCP